MMPPRVERTDAFRRRGRAAVSACALAWTLTQIGLSWSLATVAPRWRDPLYWDKKTKLDALAAARPGVPLIVMFGSSRVSNGLRGSEMDGVAAFNFGIPAAGPVGSLIHLRRVLADGPRPDLALIEILPSMLAWQIPIPVESHFHRPERLSRDEIDLIVAHGFPEDETRERHRFAAMVPINAHRFPIVGRAFPSWLSYGLRQDASRGTDAHGWQRPILDRVTPEQYRAGVAGARASYGDLLATLSIDGPVARSVHRSLAECRAANVLAAVVLMPEGRDFRALYPPQALARLDAFLARLPAPVVDARTWLGDESFSDSHHQLPDGATAFSRRLAVEARRLLAEGVR